MPDLIRASRRSRHPLDCQVKPGNDKKVGRIAGRILGSSPRMAMTGSEGPALRSDRPPLPLQPRIRPGRRRPSRIGGDVVQPAAGDGDEGANSAATISGCWSAARTSNCLYRSMRFAGSSSTAARSIVHRRVAIAVLVRERHASRPYRPVAHGLSSRTPVGPGRLCSASPPSWHGPAPWPRSARRGRAAGRAHAGRHSGSPRRCRPGGCGRRRPAARNPGSRRAAARPHRVAPLDQQRAVLQAPGW